MKRLAWFFVLVILMTCVQHAKAQPPAAGAVRSGQTQVQNATNGNCLYNNAGVLGNQACGGGGGSPAGPLNCIQLYATSTTFGCNYANVDASGNLVATRLTPGVTSQYGGPVNVASNALLSTDSVLGPTIRMGLEFDIGTVTADATNYAALFSENMDITHNGSGTVNNLIGSIYGVIVGSTGGRIRTTMLGFSSELDNNSAFTVPNAFTYRASLPSGNIDIAAAYNNDNYAGAGLGASYSMYSKGGLSHWSTGDAASVGMEIQQATSQSANLFQILANDQATGVLVFSGSGVDDALAGGTYVGTTTVTQCAKIDSVGATDTFKWGTNGNCDNGDILVPIVAFTNFQLRAGVQIQWFSSTGHTLNDKWSTTDTPATVLSHFKGDASEVLTPNVAVQHAQSKVSASAAAPGVGFANLIWRAGTNAGTCKLVSNAGTSATEVTIIDNVGGGC